MLATTLKHLAGLSLLVGLVFGQQAQAGAQELVGLLTRDLGVTEEQAAGGAGAIFGYAKERLSPGDFSKLSSAIPGLDGLLAVAPALEPEGGVLGKAGAMLGGGEASGLARLGSGFSKLGMAPDMASKFVPVILNYVNSSGGAALQKMLQQALMG